MTAPRWREVTPSEFPHEREGLAHVRELLPDRKPFRAWSNFEFRDQHGKWHEVDLSASLIMKTWCGHSDLRSS